MKYKYYILPVILCGLFLSCLFAFVIFMAALRTSTPAKAGVDVLPLPKNDVKVNPKPNNTKVQNQTAEEWLPKTPSPGVHIESIKTADWTSEMKQDFMHKLQLLHKTGSFSGGNVTHEFNVEAHAQTELRRIGGGAELKKKLDYASVDFIKILGATYQLAGGFRTGAYNNGKYDSAYFLYKSNDTEKVEIAESKMGGASHASVTLISEALNQYIGAHPATLETLQNEKGEPLININWTTNQRSYSMTTLNLGKEQSVQIAEKISLEADRIDGQPL